MKQILAQAAMLLGWPYLAIMYGGGHIVAPVMAGAASIGIVACRHFGWPRALTAIIIVLGIHFQLACFFALKEEAVDYFRGQNLDPLSVITCVEAIAGLALILFVWRKGLGN